MNKTYLIQVKTSQNKSILIACDKINRKYHSILESHKLYFRQGNQIVLMIDLEEYTIKFYRKLEDGTLIFQLQEV